MVGAGVNFKVFTLPVLHHVQLLKASIKALQGTLPLIIECCKEKQSELLGLPQPQKKKLFRAPWIEKAIATARKHKNLIGWDKFLRGFISDKWLTAQCLHIKPFPPHDTKRI